MKSIYILSILFLHTLVYAQDIIYDPDRSEAQIILEKELNEPWGKNLAPSEAFQIIKKLMLEDSYAAEIYKRAEVILKQHKIQRVEDIIQYCEDDPSGSDGGTTFHTSILEMVPRLKNDEVKWSQESEQKKQTLYETQVFSVKFFDFLLATEIPSICVNRDETIRSAYDIFVHEFVHFTEMGPFGMVERIITMETFDEYFDYSIFGKGAELDAYREGIRAEARLLSKIGVINSGSRYPFINIDGNVTDEEGFRKYVSQIYSSYYANPSTIHEVFASSVSINLARIEVLESYLKLPIDHEGMEVEISRLKKLNEKLQLP